MSRRIPMLSLCAALAAVLLIHGSDARAGFTDALKKKVSDVTKKAQAAGQQQADKANQAAGSDAASSEPAADAEKSVSPAAATKPSQVSTKFDYVPGDHVLFADDFEQDDLGEFPVRWKLESGTFEVAELEGDRWLRCVSNDGHIRMKVPAGLPEFWTLEFDGNRLDGAGIALTVSGQTATGATVWEAMFPYSGRNLAFRSGSIFSDTPYEVAPGGRHHFMFMARGNGLKVYVDRDRLASVPDMSEQGVATVIDFRLWSTEKPMIANVRFAEGCKPAKDMLDSGKLVTYGIRFATGSDVVMPESAPVLRQVSDYMGKHPDLKLRITGHTDNVGTAAANLDLSKRRAASVAKVLAEQFGVAAERFTTDGRGDSQPVASNEKPEGKAMNRRVEFAKP